MAKYLKNEKKGPGKLPVILLILVVAAALAAAYLIFLHPGDKQPDADGGTGPEQDQNMTQTADPATEPVPTLPAMAYPLVLEDGRLEITNLFQYEGINPDCGLAEGKNIASVMLRNTSGAYLEEAKISLTLVDGTVLNFTVMDLPAGKTVMAFETANLSAEENAACAQAVCTASWAEDPVALPDDIGLTVDGMTVTVTNNTGRHIPELVVYCRCPLDEDYFGGTAYQYTINDLPANESATIEALDCILGMAEVVRITENQE